MLSITMWHNTNRRTGRQTDRNTAMRYTALARRRAIKQEVDSKPVRMPPPEHALHVYARTDGRTTRKHNPSGPVYKTERGIITSCHSNGSGRPHRRHRTDRFIVFARWRQSETPSNARHRLVRFCGAQGRDQQTYTQTQRDRPPYSVWWRGTVVERRSQAGELSLSCARPAADG